MRQWDNSTASHLKKNDKYYAAEQVLTPGVYLYVDRDVQTAAQKERDEQPSSTFELLMDGKADGCPGKL